MKPTLLIAGLALALSSAAASAQSVAPLQPGSPTPRANPAVSQTTGPASNDSMDLNRDAKADRDSVAAPTERSGVTTGSAVTRTAPSASSPAAR